MHNELHIMLWTYLVHLWEVRRRVRRRDALGEVQLRHLVQMRRMVLRGRQLLLVRLGLKMCYLLVVLGHLLLAHVWIHELLCEAGWVGQDQAHRMWLAVRLWLQVCYLHHT